MSTPEPLSAPPVLEPETTPPAPATAAPRRSIVGRVFKGLGILLLVAFLTPPLVVLALRWAPPPITAFMLQSPVQPVRYHWVPAEQLPESLRLAVVASEDQKFWTHWGFDFEAIAKAMEHNENSKRVRGASTISQQVAKNLFLWPGRDWVRKGVEVSFTLLMEGLWPKERILTVYLNVAEFGPGIYGADAAARKFFNKSAAALTPPEAATLAAVLPNPRHWHAERPGPYVASRRDWILGAIGARPPEEEPPPPQGGPEAVVNGGEPGAVEMPAPVEEPSSLPSSAPPDDGTQLQRVTPGAEGRPDTRPYQDTPSQQPQEIPQEH